MSRTTIQAAAPTTFYVRRLRVQPIRRIAQERLSCAKLSRATSTAFSFIDGVTVKMPSSGRCDIVAAPGVRRPRIASADTVEGEHDGRIGSNEAASYGE